jgi:Tat protein secretion system quality control protein TatD with DNase activity
LLRKDVCGSSARKKLANTSLILRRVIAEIAELRGEEYEYVENEIYKNTLRVFGLQDKK